MIFLIFIFILQIPFTSQAASCCGGGFSIPALILGDDKAQWTQTYSYSQVSDDVLSNGRWLKRDDGNYSNTLKLDGAFLVNDTWQSGFTIPLLSKSSQDLPTSSGLGDISLYVGHESFPEKTYSRWTPKGVTFLQITLPTSPSVYDPSLSSSNESRGRGFYSLGAGLALLKSWKTWDMNFSSELHRSFSRNISQAGSDLQISPGWGTSTTLGAGWNHGDLRLGSSLGFLFEEPIKIHGSTNSEGAPQKNFTLAFTGSYMMSLESAITFSYADQSLIGNPVNSSLSKSINLSYQTRWPR